MSALGDIIEAKYLDKLPHILGAATLLVVAGVLALVVNQSRAARSNTPPISTTASVIVFEKLGCEPCDDFRTRIGKPHRSSAMSAKMPLRYYDVSDAPPPKRMNLTDEIWTTPMAVVFDVFGRETGRIAGAPKSLEDFQSRLQPFVRKAERDLADAQARSLR